MKKKSIILLVTCALLAVAAFAAGGGAEDPLASLSYLTSTYTTTVDAQVDQRLDASDAALLEGLKTGAVTGTSAAEWTETRVKQGDALTGVTGTNILLLAGSGQIAYTSGAVVDVTTGTVLASGGALTANHRYLVAEDTTATVTITSKTAVLDYQGPYSFTLSNDTVDYNAMASALKRLNLLRGSFTGYGQGFDLEQQPTRLQALIMFIRVLGEEEQALAWTGTTPFTDISKGSDAEKYVGYAYQKGYTNGYTATQFRPGSAVNVSQYTEFVLRAMGYSSSANTDLSDTLIRAQNAGVLTAGEVTELQTAKFLRAELVYISYYALDARLPNSTDTLGKTLVSKGVFTESAWKSAKALVTSQRL